MTTAAAENSPLLPLNHYLIPPFQINPTSIEVQIHKSKTRTSQFLNDINEVANNRVFSPRPSLFSWLTFSSMYQYVKKINQAPENFTLQDVPNIQSQFNIESKLLELDKYWQSELNNNSQNPSFWRALRQTFAWEILQTVFLVLIESTAKLYFSIYMGKIINTITSSSSQLISSAVIISLLVIISTFAKGWYYFLIATNIAKARLTITALLYKKLNSTSLTSVHEISIGKVLNLVGNDLNDMINLFTVPTMLLMPYMILLGTSMLWGYFGVSCLVGVGYIVLVLFIQIYLSNIANDVNKENKKITDERVRLTHETFESIRLIKMYTWDKLFQRKVHQLREDEHKGFVKISAIDALGFNLSSMSVYINIFIISVIYTLSGGVLSPEKVYASIMILMYLSSALVASHSGRMGLKNCKNIAKRTQEVLLIDDLENNEQEHINNKSGVVVFEDFSGFWSTPSSSKACLSNINLNVKPGVLTSIIGKIGSGKSSLLMSFLREIPHTTGSLRYTGRIAYVEQDPVIFSGTIRQNILFGREYNPSLYKKILQACCLDKDLESFASGDLTYIGEKGVNMSGGQKARVSLARAFYSQSDIYLLDDPFSALDSRVSRAIFNNALKGDLLRMKTVILVTHHLNFARESDHIVLMNDGEIEAQGRFSEIENLNLSLLKGFNQPNHQQENPLKEAEITEDSNKQIKSSQESVTEEKETKEEDVKVTLQTYKQYFSTEKAVQKLIIIALLFIGSQAGILYFARFIGYWAEAHTKTPSIQFNHNPYITQSLIILAITSLLSYYKVTKLLQFIYEIDTELHRKMFNALLKAQTLFFDLNPTGRILNRFSNDLGVLDKVNPKRTLEMLENGVSYIGVLITICFINPAIIVPAAFVLIGLYNLKHFFEKSVEVVRTLELQSKSPMLTAVSSTINGLKIIRAYNQGGRFVRDFMDLLFHNVKSFIFMEQIIRLFSFLLEAPIQLLTISGIWIFIALITYYNFQPGLLGLCLLYLLKIGDQGGMVVRQIIYLNMNMQSAQRMLDYSTTPSEAPDHLPRKDSKVVSQKGGKWPNKGEIVFDNVYLRYKKSLDFALKGLSLKIPAGSKVACIGRTGAGKSSIIQALFRMVEIEGYSSIEIDGVDISEIGLNLLRSSLSIIPQTPVIFADTIRNNLDPTEKLSDLELWKVLEEVGLKEHVERLEKGLDTDMKNSATVFSNGQKQLVCLGRAIINKSRIIILDEATANIDVETDAFIQKTIMEKFKDCTVLTIAHRLITIADYDRVVVIDEGRVAEYDTPYNLLVKKGEEKEKNVFAEMVKSTGSSMANKIFSVAKIQHEKSRANKGF